jgi:hypothetical protein
MPVDLMVVELVDQVLVVVVVEQTYGLVEIPWQIEK